MARGRVYAVSFKQVTVSVPQDLFQIKGAAGKTLEVLSFVLNSTNSAIPTSQMIAVEGRFLGATVTDGSGGTTPTPQKTDPGDAAASFTALANNTTQASSSGTTYTTYENAAHVYNGFDENFEANRPQNPIGPSESYVLTLLSTVSGTVSLSSTIWVREIGG